MTTEALRHYLGAEAAALFGAGSDEHFEALTDGVPAWQHDQHERDALPWPTRVREARRRPVHVSPREMPANRRPHVSRRRLYLLGMDR